MSIADLQPGTPIRSEAPIIQLQSRLEICAKHSNTLSVSSGCCCIGVYLACGGAPNYSMLWLALASSFCMLGVLVSSKCKTKIQNWIAEVQIENALSGHEVLIPQKLDFANFTCASSKAALRVSIVSLAYVGFSAIVWGKPDIAPLLFLTGGLLVLALFGLMFLRCYDVDVEVLLGLEDANSSAVPLPNHQNSELNANAGLVQS